MADPKTVRINDAENPDRLEAFERALKTSGQNANSVIRHLVDSYTKYVNHHHHGPPFPVDLAPVRGGRKKK